MCLLTGSPPLPGNDTGRHQNVSGEARERGGTPLLLTGGSLAFHSLPKEEPVGFTQVSSLAWPSSPSRGFAGHSSRRAWELTAGRGTAGGLV